VHHNRSILVAHAIHCSAVCGCHPGRSGDLTAAQRAENARSCGNAAPGLHLLTYHVLLQFVCSVFILLRASIVTVVNEAVVDSV
jgi:hypothetical protein